MSTINEFTVGKLKVRVYESRDEMGKAAGYDIACKIKELQRIKDEINMVFAAAPSQNEVLAELAGSEGIDWSRINAFHMDEYIGLPQWAPQSFGSFLKFGIFDKVQFKSVNYIIADTEDIHSECLRYADLLKEHPIDIVCLGIGENGHIAFNDPWVADFNDKEIVKLVELDEVCRQQQVNDGCFAKLEDVPKFALTLTIPALMRGKYLFCSVPAATKAKAVRNTVRGEISVDCPASILRTHDNAILYCDKDSARYL